MERNIRLQQLVGFLEPINQFLGIGHLSVLTKEGDALKSVFSHIFKKDFPALGAADLLAGGPQLNKGLAEPLSLALKASNNADVHCLAAPLPGDALLVLQGTPPANALQVQVLTFAANLYRLAEESAQVLSVPDCGGDPYRREINNLREMQAKLFPKFEGLPGLEVAGVFMPAAIMSGNFVDAFYVEETIYQIVLCEVAGSDASSSFIGSAIRTLIQADIGHRVVPSALIETVTTKLRRIVSGIATIASITVCQINTKTGQITISSSGAPPVVLYSGARSGTIHLQNTEAGKIMAKRQEQRDIQLKLAEGDSLVFYARGIAAAEAENGSESYGERRLMENIVKVGENPLIEILHGIVESIYDFTNYGPQKDDFILLGVRKPRTAPKA